MGLGKDFGPITSLHEFTLRVEGGKTCAVIGPNGAGKTTLFKILATLVAPTRGKALICGKDVTTASRHVCSTIGYVPSEERSFYWRLTGRQNLRFFGALHEMTRAKCDSRIDRLLEGLGLDGAADRRFGEYSAGMKQALSIARGLLHDPPVLLMDEPTRSLSHEASQRLYGLIRTEAEKGKAVLFSSHNLAEVDHMADTVVLLRKGRIVAAGAPEELRRKAGLSSAETMEAVYESFAAGPS